MTTSTPPRTGARPPQSTRQQLDELDALLQRMLELPVQGGDTLGRGRAPSPAEEEAAPPPVPSPPIPPRPVAPSSAPPAEQDEPVRPLTLGMSLRGAEPSEAPPAPTRGAGTPAAAPQEGQGGEWVPLRSWQPSAQTWGPLAQTWRAVQERQEQEEPSTPEAARTPPLPRFEPWTAPAAQAPARTVAPPAPPPEPVPPISTPAAVPAPSDEVPGAPNLTALLREARAEAGRGKWRGILGVFNLRRHLQRFNLAFDVLTEILLGPLGRWLAGPTGRMVLGWVGLLALLAAGALLAWECLDWT